VLFANSADAIAEGRGKAQAAILRYGKVLLIALIRNLSLSQKTFHIQRISALLGLKNSCHSRR
jgi:high-affinity K+ transport system ATPase subunit B